MQHNEYPVIDSHGNRGVLIATSRFFDSQQQRLIRTADGAELLVPADSLRIDDNGAYILDRPFAEARSPAAGGPAPLPARMHKRVETEDATIDESLFSEDYDIERVPVNRVVEEPVQARYEGDTLVLPVLEEVLVVEKRTVIREEVRITKRRSERRDPQRHSVRREHVEVTTRGE